MFKPQVGDGDKYAVGLKTSMGVSIIQTYSNLDLLKEGYKQWRTFASKGKLTQPLALELIDFKNGSGKCKILEEIMKEFPE